MEEKKAKCFICGEEDSKYLKLEGKEFFCEKCLHEMDTKIGMKCMNCGGYGFVEGSLENLQKIADITGIELKVELQRVVCWKTCPACAQGEG